MSRCSRPEILARLHDRLSAGEPLIFAGAGVGLVARAAAGSGVDVLMAYNIGAFRMDGHGSLVGYLPYGDANSITLELARRVLPMAGDVPVVGGVGAADPYRDPDALLDELLRVGYSGITNMPTAGVFEGDFRRTIDAQGLGYPREVDLVRRCREREIFTIAYAFTQEEAAQMADAGADVVAAHLGLTRAGSDQALLADAIARTNEIADAALRVRADVLVVAHGGPLENAATVGQVLASSKAIGYIGGSAFERYPVDAAVRTALREFRALRVPLRT